MIAHPAVLLDTSAWFAALSPRETRHAEARAVNEELLHARRPLVTTNLIFAEMHVLVSRARGPDSALAFLDALHADPRHEVVFVDRELEIEAVDRWIRPHRDVRLSLADATAVTLAEERGVEAALALDRHFTLAGLQLLPGVDA